MKIPAALAPMHAHWQRLEQREQKLLRRAALVVGLALLWWLALAPPLRTLSQAEVQQRGLDLQWQKMLALQAEARVLQAQPGLSQEDAVRALEVSVRQRLGASAQLSVIADSATVTLRNAPADALAQWLVQARVNARAVASEARLVRNMANPTVPGGWDGTLVLSLPAR